MISALLVSTSLTEELTLRKSYLSVPLHKSLTKRDKSIFDAGKGKDFIGYVIAPSTIHGVAHENLGNKVSDQIPYVIRTAVKLGKTVYGGKGMCSSSITLLF